MSITRSPSTFALLLVLTTAPMANAQSAELAASAAPVSVRPAPPSATELKQRFDAVLGRPGGLTAKEVGLRAKQTSPLVRARAARRVSAAHDTSVARLGYWPRLALTGRYARLSLVESQSLGSGDGSLVVTPAPAGPITPTTPLFAAPASLFSFPVLLDSFTLQAGVAVPVSDLPLRIFHANRAYSHAEKAAAIDEQATVRSQVTNAKLAYYDWVRRTMQEIVSRQGVAQAEEALRVARVIETAGRATPADVALGEAQVAGSKLMHARAVHGVESAERRIALVMHSGPGAPFAIGEDPTEDFTLPSVQPLGALYEEAIAKRPELALVREQAAQLDAQRRVTQAGNWPRLDAFANATLANPNPRIFPQLEEFRGTWDVGLQLSYSPNDTASALASADALAARTDELDAQAEALQDAIKDEVREAEVGLREATAAIDTTAVGVVAAEEAYRVRLERFRAGVATPLEMSETEVALLRARLERIEAQLGQRMAALRLVHALGRSVE
ncbi:MAG: TolC family protein [Myxococcales bacterium]|nr:TolC family protein [Myxococcales bacterium]